MPNVPVEIPLPKTTGLSRSTAISGSELVNMYWEPSAGPYGGALVQRPGLTSLWGSSVVRPSNLSLSKLTMVIGGTYQYAVAFGTTTAPISYHLYKNNLAETYSDTSLSLIPSGVTGNFIVPCDGEFLAFGYGNALYGDDTTVSNLTPPPGVTGLSGGCYQDGYAILTESNTNKWWVSRLDEISAFDGLSFTTADSTVSFCTGCASFNREIWIFKNKSIEIYQNTGASPFPFERAQVINNVGAASQSSIQVIGDSIMWSDELGGVWRATGYSPALVSTPYIGKYGAVDSWAYKMRGSSFYGALNGLGELFVYNLSTNSWSRFESTGDGANNTRWRGAVQGITNQVFVAGDVGGALNGDFHELDVQSTGAPGTEVDDDANSDVITREIITDPITAGGDRRAIMSEFYLECEVGGASGTAANAEILLSWSDDDGQTWANDRTAYLDGTNTYKTRARWTRLGSFRRRSMRIRVSDNINFVALKAWARIDTGD